MKTIALISLLFCKFLTFAQAELKVKSATVSFQIKNAGLKVDGTFSGVESKIYFNAADLPNAKIDATVDVKTINTDINSRDNHLKKEEYFDIDKYPKMSLKLSSVRALHNNTFEGNFELQIKSTKKNIVVPFTYSNKTLMANFIINRRDFGVGGSSWILSDKVLIKIEVAME